MDGSPLRRWFARLHYRLWRKGLMRSGMVTGLILALLLVGLALAFHEHQQGNLHKLKAKIETDRPETERPRPGGQDAIVLVRGRLMGDANPEFLSVTLLPGRGMNVLQITAYVPGRGEVNILASPPVEDAAAAMTGKDADANGQASLTLGSPFELPWADGIRGTPSGAGHVTTVWRGHAIQVPSTPGADEASGGLLLAVPADLANTTALPDGGSADATFQASDFGGHWPSKTRVTVNVLLSSRWIDLTMTARNTGDAPEPVGLGWHPRFAVLDGNRQQLRLRMPAAMRVEQSREKGPTGKLVPVAGTPYDFNMTGGAKLGTIDLDDCFTALHQELLDSGPVAELNDPANNYGLRLTAMSDTIKAMRVVAPAKADYVSIDPQFHYPDPFGREWARDTETGIVVLQPGQSTQWKVRLELVSLGNSEPGR